MKKEIPSLHAAPKLGNLSETRRNTLKILERIKDEENKEFVGQRNAQKHFIGSRSC